VDIFVVPLLAWHVKVDDLVLVRVVDVVRCLDMQLCRLFVFDDCAKRLRDGVQEGSLTDTRVANERDLETEVIVVDFTAWHLLLLLEEHGLVGDVSGHHLLRCGLLLLHCRHLRTRPCGDVGGDNTDGDGVCLR